MPIYFPEFTHYERPIDADQLAQLRAVDCSKIMVTNPELGAIRVFGLWCKNFIQLNDRGLASLTEQGKALLKVELENQKEQLIQKDQYTEKLRMKYGVAVLAIEKAIKKLKQKGKGDPSRQEIYNDLSFVLNELLGV